jgi:hypothetical protein
LKHMSMEIIVELSDNMEDEGNIFHTQEKQMIIDRKVANVSCTSIKLVSSY